MSIYNNSNDVSVLKADLNITLCEYIQSVADEVFCSYEINVDFSELRNAKQVLIIKSVRNEKFLDFINLLQSEKSTCKFLFLCEEVDVSFFNQLGISEDNLIFYNGRISRADIKKIPEQLINETEKICFCNYSDFRPSYANVEELGIEFLKHNNNITLYSFNVQKNTLNKYLSAEKHCEGTKLLDSIFKWNNLNLED